MAKSNTDGEFSPLTPAVFHILLALEGGARHGYAIMQAVETATDPPMRMGPGTIYGSLERMEANGLVKDKGLAADGRRRLFGLTARGKRVLRAEAVRLTHLADLVRFQGLVPGTSNS